MTDTQPQPPEPRSWQPFWQLLEEIKPAEGRYRRALRKAETTLTDSDENKAAQATGNTALAEIERAVRAWVAASACTCGRIAIGTEATEQREWNPECQEHGRYSTWWNTPEQRAAREARRAKSLELQARAREARAAAPAAPTA